MMTHSANTRDDTTNNMNDITSDFLCLKVSALCKASKISKDVRNVTIGPESILESDIYDTRHEDESVEEEEANDRVTGNIRSRLKSPSPKISTRDGITFSIKKILLENEIQRRKEVRQTMQRRLNKFEEEDTMLQEKMKMLEAAMIAERERQERFEENEIARLEAEEEHLAQQTEIKRKHEQRLHEQRILERKEKLEREAEEQRRKNTVRRILVERMVPLQASFRSTYQDISTVSKSCRYRNVMASALGPHFARLKELSRCMESLVEHAKIGDLTEEDVNTAANIVEQSQDLLKGLRIEIAQINAVYDAEIARREEEVRRVQAEEQEMPVDSTQELTIQREGTAETTEPANTQTGINVEKNTSEESEAAPIENAQQVNQPENESAESGTQESRGDGLYEFFDNDSLKNYVNSRRLLEEQTNVCSSLFKSDSMKKFRFECQKGINIPVNAISGVSRDHLVDKYEKLHRLLDGNSPVQANKHPEGIAFCKLTLAKKFVEQGETLVSSKPEMAFSVSAVAIALWKDFPDFGELLLANFNVTCPYLVPVFLPQQQGQSNEDYYRSLGYKYSDDGTIERQDKFLKRMSGLMRLYAALTVTKQRQGVTSPHPYGIKNAWRWLAATLNIEPRPDVCATMIFDMLEVAGNALWKTYPTQFPKLIAYLVQQYFPRMQKAAAGVGGGPLARLEEFLNSCLTKGTIPPPSGQLPSNFW